MRKILAIGNLSTIPYLNDFVSDACFCLFVYLQLFAYLKCATLIVFINVEMLQIMWTCDFEGETRPKLWKTKIAFCVTFQQSYLL